MAGVTVMTSQRGARAEKLNTEEQGDAGDPLAALGNLTTLAGIRLTPHYCSRIHTGNTWRGLSHPLPASRDQLLL